MELGISAIVIFLQKTDRLKNQGHSTLCLYRRNFEPGTRNSEPETRNPKPGTRNPELETRNSELGTRNPELGTRNSELETRNPELFLPIASPKELIYRQKDRQEALFPISDRTSPTDKMTEQSTPMACEPVGIIFDIKKFAIHDGPGIRTTVFFKGCPLSCWWCHNPESQRPEPETMQRPAAGGNGRARQNIPVGRQVSVSELIREIEKDVLFYDESGGGVTFSGGEPMMQPDFLAAAIDACAEREIHTALDTSGHAPEPVMIRLLERVDLLLYDIKLMDDAAHRRYTGTSNRRILSNLQAAARLGKPIVIRVPLIPGITDTDENIDRIITFLKTTDRVQHVDVLPFHHLHGDKYSRLGRTDPMDGVKPPADDRIEAVRRRFQDSGFHVTTGG